ncbi:MAG: hypothetical protein JSW60_08470 [Thermoplasmatales archaeon]|nr:MAG: hypothetical protein JSW60_08470 [Thermoplasmatales archaeon]
MRKKNVVGIILVSALLLSSPTIPAIQLNTFDKVSQNNLISQLKNLEVKEIADLIKTVQIPRHPILFLIVSIITAFRVSRLLFLLAISTDYPPGWRWPFPEITHPLIYERYLMLASTTMKWVEFWQYISCILNWNWYF